MGYQRERQGPARVLIFEKARKYGTHVSDSNGEKEEKDPKVQVKPLTRGSTFAGYPEREKPKQSCRVEGNCEISLHVKQSISIPNGREELRCVAHQRDEKRHDTQRFHATVTDDSTTEITPVDTLRSQQEQDGEQRDRREIYSEMDSSAGTFPRLDDTLFCQKFRQGR
jgi:hypothetical protein